MKLSEVKKIKDSESRLRSLISYYSNKLRETTNWVKYDKIEGKIKSYKEKLLNL